MCRARYCAGRDTCIPANFQSTEVGIASHKKREIEEKIGKCPYTIDKTIQWNPSITATIGTRIFGRFRGVATNQGVQRSHAYLISL